MALRRSGVRIPMAPDVVWSHKSHLAGGVTRMGQGGVSGDQYPWLQAKLGAISPISPKGIIGQPEGTRAALRGCVSTQAIIPEG